MRNAIPKRLAKSGMSRERYRELIWLCRQYPTMRISPKSAYDRHVVTLIELAAAQVDAAIANGLIQGICYGLDYWQIDPLPLCSSRLFYGRRNEFFLALDKLIREEREEYARAAEAQMRGGELQ